MFNIDGNPAGVAVVANRRFLLLFGPGGKWTGYLASNGAAGFNWFAVDGEWRGYCVSNSERGFNLFAKDDDWIGFMN